MANIHGKRLPERTTAITEAAAIVVHPPCRLRLFAGMPCFISAAISILQQSIATPSEPWRFHVARRPTSLVKRFEQSVRQGGIEIYCDLRRGFAKCISNMTRFTRTSRKSATTIPRAGHIIAELLWHPICLFSRCRVTGASAMKPVALVDSCQWVSPFAQNRPYAYYQRTIPRRHIWLSV